MKALVIGAGVSGLSSAIQLQKAGFQVSIQTGEAPGQTTSAAAGAIWHPLSSAADNRLYSWARYSGQIFSDLLTEPNSGVFEVPLLEPMDTPTISPRWRSLHPDITFADHRDPSIGCTTVLHYTTYLIETPIYLEYLLERFLAQGGDISVELVDDLSGLLRRDRLLVNCSGVGARELAADERVFPIRGQVVRLEAQPNLRTAFHGHTPDLGFTYIFPRRQDCILGGTQEPDVYSREPDSASSDAIRRRCERIEPTLAGAQMIEARVGLRPGRDQVRLEHEEQAEGNIIHNYGHGGIGFTLSWGCAAEVARLARRLNG